MATSGKLNLSGVGVILLMTLFSRVGVHAQQAADSNFSLSVAKPAYSREMGPVVMIDEAHHNYHTVDGRYAAFADLLRQDGYRVRSSRSAFASDALGQADILVIANALHESNKGSWILPTPSAFTDAELRAVRHWVEQGGRLLLIADHMPFPGAAAALGREFGFRFGNGYASGPAKGVFRRDDGLLKKHAITKGRSEEETITAVRTFTGQAFQASSEAVPLLVFGEGHFMRLPKQAKRFDRDTKRVEIAGWIHAAALQFGKGRVVVFGEAALFSAQISNGGKRPMGMNAPGAEQNKQLCLNVLHWLSGLLEPDQEQP